MPDPQTIDEAVDKLLAELSVDQRAELRALSRDSLIDTHFALGMHVRNAYGLLKPDCPMVSAFQDADDISFEIIRRAWERLQADAARERLQGRGYSDNEWSVLAVVAARKGWEWTEIHAKRILAEAEMIGEV